MNLVETKNCVKENIKGYKLQRTNDVLGKFGLHNTLSIYTSFASSIAMLPAFSLPSLVMGCGIAAGSLLIASKYNNHDLTEEIDYLENVKADLSIGVNNYENVSKEEFEKTLAKRRTYLHR